MLDDIYADLENGMKKSVEALRRDFTRVRTGKATPALFEGIRVDYYGAPTPLNQVANLAAPDGRLLTIAPWDTSLLPEVEKAIIRSDLGLTPTNDGKIIRIAIPPLTEERRKELVRQVKRTAEEGRVGLRQQRRDANDMLKSLEKEKEISEDDQHRGQDRVQEITDEYVKKVDELLEAKEKEIMEI